MCELYCLKQAVCKATAEMSLIYIFLECYTHRQYIAVLLIGLEGTYVWVMYISSYWWEKYVLKWSTGIQPRFSSVNSSYFTATLWKHPCLHGASLSSIGSVAQFSDRWEGRHLSNWGSALHQVCFSGMDRAAALSNTLCVSEATLKAARQVNWTDGLWLIHFTSDTPQRTVWISTPASQGDAVHALYILCVPIQACLSSFIYETFIICWGHVMWQVHNQKTIAMKNRVKYSKWHPKSIYASQVAQW